MRLTPRPNESTSDWLIRTTLERIRISRDYSTPVRIFESVERVQKSLEIISRSDKLIQCMWQEQESL